MSFQGSPRSVRAFIASFLMLGLVVFTFWAVQTRPSTARAASASLVQVTNFGNNPSNLQMWLYVPHSVKAHPPILLALHQCTGSGPGFFSGSEFANLADQYGFIVIYPSVTRSYDCWDVSSPQALTRNGGSDPVGLISMVNYVEQHNNGDSSNVYVTGASSGGMMTNVMEADYPDVFKAGSAFMGVPYHCMATNDGSQWNSACATGQITMTAQQWGNLARAADPGYTGPRPRMQLWHGTTDTTLYYANFGEEIKQWTNVLGVSQTPSFTDSPQSSWTRTRYGSTGIGAPVEGISIQGTGHVLPLSGMAAYAIQFMGLNAISNSTPTPTATVGGSTPTPTPTHTPTSTPTPGTTPTPISGASCSVHYAITNQWSGGFGASLTITNTGSTAINGWTLKFSFPNGQTISQLWNGTATQSGSAVTVTNSSYNASIPAGQALSSAPGFNGTWNGTNASPTSFTLNGSACSVV